MEEIDSIVVPTNNLEEIHEICEDAKNNHEMVAIIAPTGFGKTTGIVTYKLRNTNVVVIAKAFKSASPNIFYSSLVNIIMDQPDRPIESKYYSIRTFARYINSQQKNLLLIIDEVNKFSPAMLEYLHELRDLTKTKLGIVLCGTVEFKTYIEKWKQMGMSGIPEFYGRINGFYKLDEPRFDDIVSIIRAYNIHDRKFELECKELKDFRALTNNIKGYFKLKEKNKLFVH